MKIQLLGTYEEAEPLWRHLQKSPRYDELVYDYEVHQRLWERYHSKYSSELRILAGFEGGACRGVIPFFRMDNGKWIFSEDCLIGRDYLCAPSRLRYFIPHFPPHFAEELKPASGKIMGRGFSTVPVARIEGFAGMAEYLGRMCKKDRYNLRRVLRQNQDLRIKVDSRIATEEIGPLTAQYLEYWTTKNRPVDDPWDRPLIRHGIDMIILKRAEELGKLLALYFYEKDRLVAANFSVLRGKNEVDDYLCLRDMSEEMLPRSLGSYAILRNLEVASSRGVRSYDLSLGTMHCKSRFLAEFKDCYCYESPPDKWQTPEPCYSDFSPASALYPAAIAQWLDRVSRNFEGEVAWR